MGISRVGFFAAVARNPSPAGVERGPEGAGVAAGATGLLPLPPPPADPSELWMLSAFNNDQDCMGMRSLGGGSLGGGFFGLLGGRSGFGSGGFGLLGSGGLLCGGAVGLVGGAGCAQRRQLPAVFRV